MSGRHRADVVVLRSTAILASAGVGGLVLAMVLIAHPRDIGTSQVAQTSQPPTVFVSESSAAVGDGLLTHPLVPRTTTTEPPPPTTDPVPPPADPVPTNTPYSPPPPPLPNPVTHGVGWEAMWAVVHAAFPDAWLASGYRTTTCGQYHCIGLAIDIGAPTAARMREIDAWIAETYPQSAQLIHTPGPVNLLDGLAFVYDLSTQQDHYDHVHWALTGET